MFRRSRREKVARAEVVGLSSPVDRVIHAGTSTDT